MTTVAEHGQFAVRRALSAWFETIRDPAIGDEAPEAARSRARIVAFARAEGLGWNWQGYTGNHCGFEWCGAFAAFAWRTAIKPEILFSRFASTVRLLDWGKEDPARRVEPFSSILPGDIVTVNGPGAAGKHITIAVAWSKARDELITVEGNAHGRLPDGTWAEGVVMNIRSRSEIRAAYRPTARDLIGA